MSFELSLPELNIAQMFGFLSYILGVSCFYQKDDRKLKIVMVIMSLNNALHYALLGAITACLSSLFSLLRTGKNDFTTEVREVSGHGHLFAGSERAVGIGRFAGMLRPLMLVNTANGIDIHREQGDFQQGSANRANQNIVAQPA